LADVRWSEQALEDLDAICLFIARDAPMAARIFADKTFQATDRLEKMPQMGRVVPEFCNDTIRELILGSYRVIYCIREDLPDVEILTIHHGARPLKMAKNDPMSGNLSFDVDLVDVLVGPSF